MWCGANFNLYHDKQSMVQRFWFSCDQSIKSSVYAGRRIVWQNVCQRKLAYSTEHCQTLGNSCECHGFSEITFQTDVPCHSWHDTLPPSWGLLFPMMASPNERKILQWDKNKQNHSWFTRKIFVVNCTLYVMPFYFITLKQESF